MRSLFPSEDDDAFLGLWRHVAWGVCRNQVFACFCKEFCNLLEPSARAGGSRTVWTLQSSVSFGVSQSKTTSDASHPHRPSMFFGPCFSGVCSSLERCRGQEETTPRKGDDAGGGLAIPFSQPLNPQPQGCGMGGCPTLRFLPGFQQQPDQGVEPVPRKVWSRQLSGCSPCQAPSPAQAFPRRSAREAHCNHFPEPELTLGVTVLMRW